MLKMIFRKTVTTAKPDGFTPRQTRLLLGLVLLIALLVSCSSLEAEVAPTAVPATHVTPTEIPPANEAGETPLDIAILKSNDEIAQLLQDAVAVKGYGQVGSSSRMPY